MHQALYRKYRPAVFSDVVGQTQITSVLRYQVKEHRTSHAYLFCGSRGTGKTTCAKILAKAVNCLSPVDGDPCGKCANCLAIENGSTTDVIEMDAASNTGVDYIRDIKDEVMYAPSMLTSRVYIIDEVHMLTDSAFNALLKTLEEPPAHVLFIMATTEQQKIPATILSRCQRFEFTRIPADVICKRLFYIAEREHIGLEEDAARLIARAAQGGMRDAISLLELCSADGEKITPERAVKLSGGVGRKVSEDTVRAIADRDGKAIFDVVASIYASTGDLGVFWQELIGYYRDMTVFKTLSDMPREELRREILDLTEGEYEMLTELSGRFRYETLLYHSSVLEKALPYIGGKTGLTGRICAEMALLRLTVPKLDTDPAALLDRISKLEEALLYGKVGAGPVEAPDASGGERIKTPEAPPKKPAKEQERVSEDGLKNRPPKEKEKEEKEPERTPEKAAAKPPAADSAGADAAAVPSTTAEAPAQNARAAKAKEKEEPADKVPEASSRPEAPGSGKRTEIKNFVDLRSMLSARDPSTSGLLENARAFDLHDGTVEVEVKNEFWKTMLEDARAEEALSAILASERGIRANVVFTVSSDGGGNSTVTGLGLFDLE